MNEPLDLPTALQIARRRGWIVALALMLGLVAAWNVTRHLPVRYQATATLFVGANAPTGDPSTDLQYAALAQNLAASYAEIARTKQLALTAARESGLPASALVGRITAEAHPGLQILRIRATASSGPLAARAANAAARALTARVQRLTGPKATHVALQPIDEASAPRRPASPQPALDLLAGALAALIVGVALALSRERLDRRIRTPADAEGALDLPVLGVIPQLSRRARHADAFVRHAHPAIAEPARSLAITLASIAQRAGHRRVLITSARPREGKSLVAAQLALAAAENHRRVALVEGDLRRPSLERHFQPRSTRRLHGLLRRRSTESSIPDALAEQLTLLLATTPDPDAGRAVRTPTIKHAVDALAADHDLVLIDTPPALTVSDAAILAEHADAVLLVVRLNHTTPDDARTAIAGFRRLGIGVIGVVLVGGRSRPNRRYHSPNMGTSAAIRLLNPSEPETKGQVAT